MKVLRGAIQSGVATVASIFSENEARRQAAIADLDLWLVPQSEDEPRLATSINRLDFTDVERLDGATLRRFGITSKNCHANVANYIRRTRLRSARVVTGWWDLGSGAYVLHSVVATWRRLVCVTPYFDKRHLRFAVDRSLYATPKGVASEFVRDGSPVQLHVRYDYHRVIAECGMIRERLLLGMNPARAYGLSDAN